MPGGAPSCMQHRAKAHRAIPSAIFSAHDYGHNSELVFGCLGVEGRCNCNLYNVVPFIIYQLSIYWYLIMTNLNKKILRGFRMTHQYGSRSLRRGHLYVSLLYTDLNSYIDILAKWKGPSLVHGTRRDTFGMLPHSMCPSFELFYPNLSITTNCWFADVEERQPWHQLNYDSKERTCIV